MSKANYTKKILIALIVLVLVPYVLSLVYLYNNQAMLIFPAWGEHFDSCKELKALGGKAIRQKTGGEEVRYYFFENPRAKGWLIFFHGNGGTLCGRGYTARHLKELPLNIVMAEYPGYGGDSTEPTEERVLKNATALMSLIKTRAGNQPIFIKGRSLGTGPATYLAANWDTAGLILQTPYTSIRDLAVLRYKIPLIDLFINSPFYAEQWAPLVTEPVIVLHGDLDTLIPIENAREQAGNFTRADLKFVVIEGADHNNLATLGGEKYWKPVAEFVNGRLSP